MRLLLMIAATITVATSVATFPAYAQTCQQLWVERNQYTSITGYCFNTQRAIDTFGNGGCYINNENAVTVTRAERARVAKIVQQERAMGCNIDGGGGNTAVTCDQVWSRAIRSSSRAATASRRNAPSSISAMAAAFIRTKAIFRSRKLSGP